MTTPQITSKRLFHLQPGDYVERIPERRMRGPRGGRYIVGGELIHARLVEQKLSADGRFRVFTFDRPLAGFVAPVLKVPSKLSLQLTAEVREQS